MLGQNDKQLIDIVRKSSLMKERKNIKIHKRKTKFRTTLVRQHKRTYTKRHSYSSPRGFGTTLVFRAGDVNVSVPVKVAKVKEIKERSPDFLAFSGEVNDIDNTLSRLDSFVGEWATDRDGDIEYKAKQRVISKKSGKILAKGYSFEWRNKRREKIDGPINYLQILDESLLPSEVTEYTLDKVNSSILSNKLAVVDPYQSIINDVVEITNNNGRIVSSSQASKYYVEGIYTLFAKDESGIPLLYKVATYLKNQNKAMVLDFNLRKSFTKKFGIASPVFKDNKWVFEVKIVSNKVGEYNLMPLPSDVEATASTSIRRRVQAETLFSKRGIH